MPAPVLNTKLRTRINLTGIALMTLVLAGCAQQKAPGYYAGTQDSTLSDAQNQAQGRATPRAPSQIQLGFGDTQKPKASNEASNAELADKAAIAATVRPLVDAKTFLGTVPCLSGTQCSAARVTLTLAPNGQWRARTLALGSANAKPITEQGCWSVIGTDPWRILLRTKSQASKASLSFVNDNVLKINSINDTQPTLDYHLTRQPDIDSIDELNKEPALKCN